MKTLDKNASIKDAILYFNDDTCSLYSTEKDVIKKFENEFAAKIPVYSVNAQEQTDWSRDMASFLHLVWF